MMQMIMDYRGIFLGIAAFVMGCWSAHADPTQLSKEHNEPTSGSSRCRERLEAAYMRGLDMERYGLMAERKHLDLATLEWALAWYRAPSDRVDRWAKGTLRAHVELVDALMGGAYEYSLGGDWKHPCFTKTLAQQSVTIALYAAAYRILGIEEYLSIAERSVNYVESYMKASSGYYFASRGSCDFGDSPEADSGEAYVIKRGAIEKDERVSLAENANFVRALTELYAVSTRERFKELAIQGARKLMADESGRPESVVVIEPDSATRELLDRVAIGRALYALYSITGDTEWLREAIAVLNQIVGDSGVFVRSLEERVAVSSRIEAGAALARFSNLIYSTVKEDRYREMAKRALASVLSGRCEQAGVVDAARLLLAEEELGVEPPHAVLLGSSEDSRTEELWRAMLSRLPHYVRRERFSSVSALKLGAEMYYPRLSKPAAFMCANKRCSVPIFTAAELIERIAEMMNNNKGVGYEDH